MEQILRRKEMAEIILLPVRHHSPACAWHIVRMIEKLKPDAVLIEGPENAGSLIPVSYTHLDTIINFIYIILGYVLGSTGSQNASAAETGLCF